MPLQKFRRDSCGHLYLNYNEPITGTKQDTLIGNDTTLPPVQDTGTVKVIVPIDDGGMNPTGGVKPLPYSDSNIEFDYGTATCAQLQAVINYIAGPAQALMTSQQAQDYYYTRNNEAKAAWLSKNCSVKSTPVDGTTSTPGPVTSSGSTPTTTTTSTTPSDTPGDTVIGQKDESTTLNVGSIGISPTGATSSSGIGGGAAGGGSGGSSAPRAAAKKFNWWIVIACGAIVLTGLYMTRNKTISLPK